MKTKIVFLTAFLGVAFSCKNSNDETPKPEEKLLRVFDFFKEVHTSTIQFQAANIGSFLSIKDGKFVIDQEGLGKKTMDQMNQKFYHLSLSTGDLSKIATSMSPKTKTMSGRTQDEGNPIEQNYIEDMGGASDYTQARSITQSYVYQVIAAPMPYEDQVHTLALVAAGDAWSNYVFSGAAARDYGNVLIDYPGDEYQSLGNCSVNWRGVFIGATIGFFTGFVSGCYAGAVGGTVIVPVAGTVAGCIGVGFVGGAGGYATGVATGIVGSLIESCTRNG